MASEAVVPEAPAVLLSRNFSRRKSVFHNFGTWVLWVYGIRSCRTPVPRLSSLSVVRFFPFITCLLNSQQNITAIFSERGNSARTSAKRQRHLELLRNDAYIKRYPRTPSLKLVKRLITTRLFILFGICVFF